MDITGKKIAILTHNYFEQAELDEPLSTLKDAGGEVTIISASGDKKLRGMNHAEMGDNFTADLLLEEANDIDYDALVLPGGAMNADALRMVDGARQWTTDFLNSGRPLAVICHASWVLVSADLVDGHRLTSFFTIQDDINNAGGDWVDEPVVIDDNLITSRKPDDLPQFNEAIIKMLSSNLIADAKAPETAATEHDVHPLPPDEQPAEEDERLKSLGYDKQRDQISDRDEKEILADEDETDPDEIRPSRAVSGDENDDTR